MVWRTFRLAGKAHSEVVLKPFGVSAMKGYVRNDTCHSDKQLVSKDTFFQHSSHDSRCSPGVSLRHFELEALPRPATQISNVVAPLGARCFVVHVPQDFGEVLDDAVLCRGEEGERMNGRL